MFYSFLTVVCCVLDEGDWMHTWLFKMLHDYSLLQVYVGPTSLPAHINKQIHAQFSLQSRCHFLIKHFKK